MLIRQLFDSATSTYTYLVADPIARVAGLIDPVREQVDRDIQIIRELGLRLIAVIETHVHADHVTGAGTLRDRTGARTYASSAGAPCVDTQLLHGSSISIGSFDLTVLATPGHTNDSMSFYAPGVVFTGDSLLVRGCGRTDFQNGDPGQLYDAITKTLFALPDSTVVYPGHDYHGHTVSTIGEEKRFNPRLAHKSRDEFIAIMNNLGLSPPQRIAEAVPANRACGNVGA